MLCADEVNSYASVNYKAKGCRCSKDVLEYTMVRKRVLALKISYGTKRCSWPLEEAIGWFVFPKSDCKTWIRGHGLREDRTGIGDSGFAC